MICDIPMQASSGSVDPKLFHMQPPAGLYKGPRRVQIQHRNIHVHVLQYAANLFVILMLYSSNLTYMYMIIFARFTIIMVMYPFLNILNV